MAHENRAIGEKKRVSRIDILIKLINLLLPQSYEKEY